MLPSTNVYVHVKIKKIVLGLDYVKIEIHVFFFCLDSIKILELQYIAAGKFMSVIEKIIYKLAWSNNPRQASLLFKCECLSS